MSIIGSSSAWSYASFATLTATNHDTRPQRIRIATNDTASARSSRAWMLPTSASLRMFGLLPKVAEAAHGADDDAGRLELRAQPRNVHLDGIRRDRRRAFRYGVRDRQLRERLPGSREEDVEQRPVAGGEIDRLLADACPPRSGIERQVADRDPRRDRRLHAPQQRTHARLELGQRERLRQVVVGPEVETVHALVDFLTGGDDEHGRGVRARSQAPQHLESVDVGQPDVEKQQVVTVIAKQRVRIMPAPRVPDAVTLLLQCADQAFGEQRIVFDNENAQTA